MRLCLDEHYSSKIAEELRAREYDVYAVSERPELRTLSDRELWLHVQSEQRALLTDRLRLLNRETMENTGSTPLSSCRRKRP